MNAAQIHHLNEEKDKVLGIFAGNINTKYRVSSRLAKLIILNAPYMFQGRMWDIKAKSLGAGVYELSLKET